MSGILTIKKMKANARLNLKTLKENRTSGDPNVLLDAITICSLHKVAVPKWVVDGLAKEIHRVNTYQVASWDDVFKKPLKKGEHLNAARKNYKLKRAVPVAMWLETKAQPSLEAAFRATAKKLLTNETAVKEIYYEVKAILDKRRNLSEKQ